MIWQGMILSYPKPLNIPLSSRALRLDRHNPYTIFSSREAALFYIVLHKEGGEMRRRQAA